MSNDNDSKNSLIDAFDKLPKRSRDKILKILSRNALKVEEEKILDELMSRTKESTLEDNTSFIQKLKIKSDLQSEIKKLELKIKRDEERSLRKERRRKKKTIFDSEPNGVMVLIFIIILILIWYGFYEV